MADNTNTNKAVATTENRAAGAVSNLTNGVASLYSSIKGDTQAEKIKILEAVTDPEPLSEHLNETINLKHVIVQATQITDDKTGEVSDVLRTILIAEDGTAYAAISTGLFQYLKNLFDIVGQPADWEGPLAIQVFEKRGRSGYRYMTVKMA